MNKEEIFQQIRGKLIVSCQANEEENPFNPPEEMTRMAKAAAIGGCAGFRANRPENVRMIKEAFPDKVMIGIWKVVTEGCDVYITPTMKEVEVRGRSAATSSRWTAPTAITQRTQSL